MEKDQLSLSLLLSQTNQSILQLQILTTCSFTTKASKSVKSALTPFSSRSKSARESTDKAATKLYGQSALTPYVLCRSSKLLGDNDVLTPLRSGFNGLSNDQTLVLDSLRLPQKKLVTKSLKPNKTLGKPLEQNALTPLTPQGVSGVSGVSVLAKAHTSLRRHPKPKSGIDDLLFSTNKRKIKKETQNLRTIFQEASFSPLFSLQEERNKKLVENQGLRAVWKAKVINSSVPPEKRKEAMQALAQLPKNPLHTPRLCILSGRSKGVYKKFRLSRHNIRSLLGQGILQGVKKASW